MVIKYKIFTPYLTSQEEFMLTGLRSWMCFLLLNFHLPLLPLPGISYQPTLLHYMTLTLPSTSKSHPSQSYHFLAEGSCTFPFSFRRNHVSCLLIYFSLFFFNLNGNLYDFHLFWVVPLFVGMVSSSSFLIM